MKRAVIILQKDLDNKTTKANNGNQAPLDV